MQASSGQVFEGGVLGSCVMYVKDLGIGLTIVEDRGNPEAS
jgi:hypothetical protein